MAEQAAHWVDRVIPRVAVRQLVLTVPWPRRWLLARRPDLANGVLNIAIGKISRWSAKRCRQPDGKTGSITVQQRFGSALNLNLHYHIIGLDGVYIRDEKTGVLRFHRAPRPTTAEVEALVIEIAEASEAFLATKGFGEGDEGEPPDEDDALALFQKASLHRTTATGPRAGKALRRQQVFAGKAFALPQRCGSYDGYNLHAGVEIGAGDRKGLEQLCRYISRPPLASERVEVRQDGTVAIGLKRIWSDGTRAIELSAMELVEKLAAIIPPPFVNQTIYHGVLAGNAAWRKEVVPKPPPETPTEAERRLSRTLRKGACSPALRATWAELLTRVFAVDGWQCPSCGRQMRLRATLDGAPVTTHVLRGLWCRGPPEDGESGR